MPRNWRVVTALAVLAGSLTACGFADDNYTNAEKALQNSRPNLTVPATVTTMKPFETIPGSRTTDSIPVKVASPEEVAAARARASGAATPGSASGAGALRPAPVTTTTQPDTPLCRSAQSLQEVGELLTSARGAAPADFPVVVATALRALDEVVSQLRKDLVPGWAEVRQTIAVWQGSLTTIDTVAEMRRSLQDFLRTVGPQVTKTLQVVSLYCPQQFDGSQRAEDISDGL